MKPIKSKFFRDGITLVSGNAWAQVVTFAAYLLLTRLFSPEEFGLYNIFFSYIDVLVIVSTCKYEMAVVIASDDKEASAVSRLALRINAIVSVALFLLPLLLFLFSANGSILGSSGIPVSLALLLPPMVFFCGTSRVYAAMLNRHKSFSHIALSEVVGSTSGSLLKILFGLPLLIGTLWHNMGLALGTVIGKIASNINYYLKIRKERLLAVVGSDERRKAARKYRNFPLYTMPKDLVNSLSFNLPFILLALYFDKVEVGLFSLALTATFRPVNLLNTAFEKLLYVRVAEKVRARQSIKGDIMRFVALSALVSLPLFLVAFFYGDAIFGFIFGRKWSSCGYYIRCMVPWVYVSLTSASLVFLANVFSRQRTEFVFYIILLFLRVASMVAGIALHDFRLAILLFALSGAAIYLSLLIWYLTLVARYESGTSDGLGQ